MKRISEIINLESAQKVFETMAEESPFGETELKEAIAALDGIADQLFARCGDSPEAIRGVVMMMSVMMELLHERPDDQDVELDSFLLTFGMPFLFARLTGRPEIRSASELLDRIS